MDAVDNPINFTIIIIRVIIVAAIATTADDITPLSVHYWLIHISLF